MGVSGKGQGRLDFELNLIPFIDILSTCICFLLMTTVFLHLGSLDTKQALGNETLSGGKNKPSLFVKLHDNGDVKFMLKDIETGNQPREYNIAARGSQVNWNESVEALKNLKSTYPDLETALVLPSERSKYKEMIQMMDELKRATYKDIGISPL